MGVRRNFSRGGAASTFCLYFSGCWCYNANGCSQNAVLFLHHKQNAPWKHALHSNLFQVGLYTVRVCHKRVHSVIRYRFCWIGAYSHNWVWNGPELSI